MMIDGDKLTAWLTEQKKAWADLVVGFLPEFEMTLDFTKYRTPLNEMVVPVETRVRAYAPHTSFTAAVAQTAQKSQRLYLRIETVMESPMTDPELFEVLSSTYPMTSFTGSGVRTRRAELRDAGWIVDSGVKRENHIVWEWVK